MRGVLTAGCGDRLRPFTGDRPKCPDRLITAGAIKDWAPSAFAGFCQRRPRHVVDHRGLPWIEIDSPKDYWRACTHIAPVLDDAVPAAGTAVRMAADHV